MQNKNKKKSNLFFNCLIIALAAVSTLSASVMAGCTNSESSETSATTVVKETQIVTEIVTVTENVTVSDESTTEIAGESSAESSEQGADSGDSSQGLSNNNQSSAQASSSASSKASGSSNTSSVSSSSKTSSSSSKTSSSTSTSSSSKTSSSSGNTSNNASSDVLSIAGNKFHVGDTVTCVLNITTPEIVENYQGTLKYDDKYLEATSAKLENPAKGGGLLNYKKSGLVIFNGSSASTGYDYTSGGEMLTVTFKVKAAGSTTPSVDWVVVRQLSSGINGTNYISDGKPANGMKASLSYS